MDVVSDIFSTPAIDSTYMFWKALMLQPFSLLNVTSTSSLLLSSAESALTLRSKTPQPPRHRRVHVPIPHHRPHLCAGAPGYLRELSSELRLSHPQPTHLRSAKIAVYSDPSSVMIERRTITTFCPLSQKQRDNDSRCCELEQNRLQIQRNVLRGHIWERTSAQRSRCKIVFFVVHTRTRLYE